MVVFFQLNFRLADLHLGVQGWRQDMKTEDGAIFGVIVFACLVIALGFAFWAGVQFEAGERGWLIGLFVSFVLGCIALCLSLILGISAREKIEQTEASAEGV